VSSILANLFGWNPMQSSSQTHGRYESTVLL
jgi:hypothetical protein